jgi:TolB protein
MRRIALLVLLAGVTVLSVPVGARATFPGSDGRLAYVARTQHPQAIYTIDPDGTDGMKLLDAVKNTMAPDWTADGSRIAFVRYGRSTQSLVSTAADGSDLQVIARNAALPRFVKSLAWSPDGSRIALCAGGAVHSSVFVIDADGTDLTEISPPGTDDCHPSWSPDGTRIAVDTETSVGSIVTMDPDGSNRVTVLATGDSIQPDWSPDGTQLVIVRFGPRGRPDLFTVPSDGGSPTRLTDTPEWELYPSWAPDGSAVAYCRSRQVFTYADLFTVTADGATVTRLTDTKRRDEWDVDWQSLP